MMLAGAAIGYKTKFQGQIAHSTTNGEWVAAVDVGKMSFYFRRSCLDDLYIPQYDTTVIYEDNRGGALFMANAQQTSPRTRHIDIREFALVDWILQDLLILEGIKTTVNCADSFTKALARILFYRHNDTVMGRRIPTHLLPLFIVQDTGSNVPLTAFLNEAANNIISRLLFTHNHTPISVAPDYSSCNNASTGTIMTLVGTPQEQKQQVITLSSTKAEVHCQVVANLRT